MNRKIWEDKILHNGLFPCPKCFSGNIIGLNKISQITEEGKELSKHNYPYGIENLFCGILKCNRCNEIVSVNGSLLTEITEEIPLPDGNYEIKELSISKPMFFYPNLRMFSLSKEIPKPVIKQVDLAFSYYFHDNNSCANKIRTAIEVILDDIKAPLKKFSNGRLRPIPNLHQRIENYRKSKPRLCQLLLALKVIGNEGSHNSKTETKDLLDAFEILELALDTLYLKSTKRIEALAKTKTTRNII